MVAWCAVVPVHAQQAKPRGTSMDLGQLASTEINTAPLGFRARGFADLRGAWSKRKGRVVAVHVTADVTFVLEGGLVRQKLRSFDHLLIESTGPGPRDDLSIMMEDVETCPRPIGVVNASSGRFALALPMARYVDGFGITLVNGCQAGPGASAGDGSGSDPAAVARANAVRLRHDGTLFNIEGVVGSGVGLSNGLGQVPIEVYVEKATPAIRESLPSTLEGVPVRVVETGRFTSHY